MTGVLSSLDLSTGAIAGDETIGNFGIDLAAEGGLGIRKTSVGKSLTEF